MCGNGARCVAQYLKNTSVKSGKWKVESGKRHVSIETKAGRVTAEVRSDRVAMRLTDPTNIRANLSLRVNGRTVRATHLNTGVPHTVVPVTELDRVPVQILGRALRFHWTFAPSGTNVDFIQPSAGATRLHLRTYERGVEAETLACGTGVAASAVAYILSNGGASGRRRHHVTVQTRSGDRMAVSFTVVPSGRRVAVTDLVLAGRVRRIGEGMAAWPREGGT